MRKLSMLLRVVCACAFMLLHVWVAVKVCVSLFTHTLCVVFCAGFYPSRVLQPILQLQRQESWSVLPWSPVLGGVHLADTDRELCLPHEVDTPPVPEMVFWRRRTIPLIIQDCLSFMLVLVHVLNTANSWSGYCMYLSTPLVLYIILYFLQPLCLWVHVCRLITFSFPLVLLYLCCTPKVLWSE